MRCGSSRNISQRAPKRCRLEAKCKHFGQADTRIIGPIGRFCPIDRVAWPGWPRGESHLSSNLDDRAYSTRAPATPSRAFMELWQARCVQGYVAVHLHSKITLEDLAKAASSSRCKFPRSFKASFGCTPGQYVRRMRIARAQNLMTLSRDPLSRIAAECGFADESHFNRCFRKIVGDSPAVWRAQRCESSAKAQWGAPA